MAVRSIVCAVVTLLLVSACDGAAESADESSSGPGSSAVSVAPVSDPPTKFGTARIEPATVPRGGSLTIVPSSLVERWCGGWSTLYALGPDGLEEVGQLTNEGDLTPMPEATYMPCAPAPSDDAESYDVPAGLTPGDYVVCIWSQTDPSSCGTVTVSSERANVPPER